MTARGPSRHFSAAQNLRHFGPILLQNSKVAGRRISRENKRLEAIADSYSFTTISEVACEFTVRR
jgi:hypothetical protein